MFGQKTGSSSTEKKLVETPVHTVQNGGDRVGVFADYSNCGAPVFVKIPAIIPDPEFWASSNVADCNYLFVGSVTNNYTLWDMAIPISHAHEGIKDILI